MFGLVNRLFSGQKKPARRSTFAPQIEALETRELLSGFSALGLTGRVTTPTTVSINYPHPQPTAAGLALLDNLPDTPVRSTALTDYQRDGMISRNDMIDIFDNGTQDFTYVLPGVPGSLNTLVNNGPTLDMPPAVQNLSSKVMAGVSSLGQGSAQTIEKNVNNFFLGLARPTDGVRYTQVNEPLWNPSSRPSYNDVQQIPNPFDAWLGSTMKEVAYRDPDAILQMFTDNGDGTYTVRFFHGSTPDYVTVDNYLMEGRGVGVESTVLWPMLLEKAYAQENAAGWIGSPKPGVNSFLALKGSPGDPRWAFAAITGQSGSSSHPVDPAAISTAWSQGQFLVLHTSLTWQNPGDAGQILDPSRLGMWWSVVNVSNDWVTLSALRPGDGLVEVNTSVVAQYFDVCVQSGVPTASAARQTHPVVGHVLPGTELVAASQKGTQATVQPTTSKASVAPPELNMDHALLAALAAAKKHGVHIVLFSSHARAKQVTGDFEVWPLK